MALTDQRHAVRLPMPDLIVRGADHIVYAPVYLSGALVAPSDGTVSLYDPSSTAKVSAAAVTISGSIAQYTIAAATLADEPLGEGWRIEWTLNLASGATLTPRNDAALVRAPLWPVVTDEDLFRLCPSLDPDGAAVITSDTDYQAFLDEAWAQINLRLIAAGNRPNLIMEPSALRMPHLYLTLALIFENLATRLNPAYAEIASTYREHYQAAWADVNPRYDVGDSGQADSRRRQVSPTVWLCGGRDRWR